jgi:hypothetical protein
MSISTNNDIIIIVAVYLSDDNINNYNITINCLKSIRNNYKDNKIIAVDNNSINKQWYKIAVELNIYLLNNTSSYYKYESGAYLYALKYFRAKKYIFIQGNIEFHKQIDLILDETIPDAGIFNSFNNICLDSTQKLMLDECNKKLNIPIWDYDKDVVATWCCFFCNDLFINEILKDNIFKLKCNNKIMSCLYERIISIYIRYKIGIVKSLVNNYNQDTNKIYTKYHFNQL